MHLNFARHGKCGLQNARLICSLCCTILITQLSAARSPQSDQSRDSAEGCWKFQQTRKKDGACPGTQNKQWFLCINSTLGGGMQALLTVTNNDILDVKQIQPDQLVACFNASSIMSTVSYDLRIHPSGKDFLVLESSHSCTPDCKPTQKKPMRGKLTLGSGTLTLATADTPGIALTRYIAEDYVPLGIQSDTDPITILVDGVSVSGIETDRVDGQVRLRAPKSIIANLKDGLHDVTVKFNALSRTAYIYKEASKADLFRPYANSYAIVVSASGGWDAAEFVKLDSAVPQARKVADVLNSQGFHVETFFEQDATVPRIEAYLQNLSTKLKSNDRVLFYFSGHGDTETGPYGEVGYLLTYPATRKTLITDAIPMSRLQSEYANLPAKHMLFVLDACFAGLALQRSSLQAVDTLRKFLQYEEIATYTEKPTRAILAAGTKGQPSLDVNGGIFTKAFLDGVEGAADYDHDGVITVDELAVFIQTQVGNEAHLHGYQQTPQLSQLPLFGDGKFVFLK